MVAQSKLWTTASCYELGHTWNPSCRHASLDLGKAAYSYSLRLYAIFYIVARLIRGGKFDKKSLKNTASSIFWSTNFLSAQAIVVITNLCLWRRLFGGFNLHFAFLCGIPACFIAISIERKERRGMLALYVSNLAAEILFNMAVCRGYIKPIKYGEVLLFSLTTGIALYLLRSGDILQNDAQSTLRSLFGSSELPSHVQEAGLRGGTSPAESSSVFSTIAQYLPREIKRLLAVLSQRVKDLPSHQLCKHEGSCVHYISEGFLSRFCLGYAIQTAFNLFRSIPKVMQQPARVPWSLLDKGNVYLGLFMGGLVGLFRLIMCLLRWVRNKDSPVHALIAGFLSGLSSVAYRSNAIALYFASRVIENLFFFAQKNGYVPPIPGGDRILYTLSTSTILHASVFEPHTIRPAYWQFLLRVTGNYFAHMNRKIVDVLGTQASKLYPDFWPKYDVRYIVPQLQTEELYNWWLNNVFLKK
ncbi:transmembrane protein 135-like isoform X2 [Apostichopus japonicus]|uniref:transmembrane protein 135-like isoform X2 n=1 Tax=Stichopus japonicus TaxID=307972 RepID=UPI003AB29318